MACQSPHVHAETNTAVYCTRDRMLCLWFELSKDKMEYKFIHACQYMYGMKEPTHGNPPSAGHLITHHPPMHAWSHGHLVIIIINPAWTRLYFTALMRRATPTQQQEATTTTTTNKSIQLKIERTKGRRRLLELHECILNDFYDA